MSSPSNKKSNLDKKEKDISSIFSESMNKFTIGVKESSSNIKDAASNAAKLIREKAANKDNNHSSSHGSEKDQIEKHHSTSTIFGQNMGYEKSNNSISITPVPIPVSNNSNNNIINKPIEKTSKGSISDVLSGLGMSEYGSRSEEKKLIYQQHYELIKTLSSSSYNDIKEGYLPLERFVIDMLKRGYSPLWADAAFRAFDYENSGGLDKTQYLLANIALKVDFISLHNSNWLELRRQLIFAYYDRQNKGYWDDDAYREYLVDVSQNDSDEPQIYGIVNKNWNLRKSDNDENSGGTPDNLAKALAISRVQLAQKNVDYEELQLSYLKLEKKMCQLKLELAQKKDKIDETNVKYFN
jgi:hypothetical protein